MYFVVIKLLLFIQKTLRIMLITNINDTVENILSVKSAHCHHVITCDVKKSLMLFGKKKNVKCTFLFGEFILKIVK